MNYCAVATIDTNRGFDTFRHKICLNKERMEGRISNDSLFINIIAGAILLWFILVTLEIL